MHTLEQLQSGELRGIKRLQMACGFTHFPEEIYTLADTLEILDLSGNAISTLPAEISRLKNMKVIFFGSNNFTEFPKELAACEKLSMIGFKSNKITHIPADAFPKHLRWLILTDNQIKEIPASIGSCIKLQKCALAGNQLQTLPVEMKNCVNLELLRISANKITKLPEWLLTLPRLSWIAYSGNPCSYNASLQTEMSEMDWSEFEIQQLLGEGASGFISKAQWPSKQKEVAVKVFKGAVTSDGWPEDEMQTCLAAGSHENLVQVIGKVNRHPEKKQALVFELIPSAYKNLSGPPSLDTCTRDVLPAGSSFSLQEILKIATGVASLCLHFHERGIMHGDLYAHNILVNADAHSLLGDFGAATFYDVNHEQAKANERVEVRAYGCLLEDMLNHLQDADFQKAANLFALKEECMQENPSCRPLFSDIFKRLRTFAS